jgi:hypothetical protein
MVISWGSVDADSGMPQSCREIAGHAREEQPVKWQQRQPVKPA